MILDLERSDCPDELECDVAIVGSGAVGLLMAVDLARRGADVLLLEGGGVSVEASAQALNEGESLGRPLSGIQRGRFRLLGGATSFWGGQLVRFDPIVFQPRPWLASSGWPFGRVDLDPYYDRCARMLGLADSVED
jgi:choline dehydrogenase-like flavoprotein